MGLSDQSGWTGGCGQRGAGKKVACSLRWSSIGPKPRLGFPAAGGSLVPGAESPDLCAWTARPGLVGGGRAPVSGVPLPSPTGGTNSSGMRNGARALNLVLMLAAAGLVLATVFALAARLWWAFDLFSHFRLQYAVAALILLVAALALRDHRIAVVLAVVALVHGWAIKDLWLGGTASAAQCGMNVARHQRQRLGHESDAGRGARIPSGQRRRSGGAGRRQAPALVAGPVGAGHAVSLSGSRQLAGAAAGRPAQPPSRGPRGGGAPARRSAPLPDGKACGRRERARRGGRPSHVAVGDPRQGQPAAQSRARPHRAAPSAIPIGR